MTPRQRPCLVVHYHEISLKAGHRPMFLRHLRQNLERATADLQPVKVVQLPGRLMLDLEGNHTPEAVRERVRRVCGVANLALAQRVTSQMDAIKAAVGRMIEGR